MLRLLFVLALLAASPAQAATGVLAVGDFGVGGQRQRALGAAVRAFEERNPADVLVTLGDNDYTRGRAFATSWQASFGWLASAGVDVAGALGNHDVEVRRGRYQFALLHMPGPYYVRRVNEVELIVLDSTAVTARQTRWLEQTLAVRRFARRIVAFHHPPWTCGAYVGSAAVRRAWVPLFERYGVRLVLSGHDHNYQRFARNGVTYVVHGGGASLYPLRRCPSAHPRRLAARAARGFLYLTVEPDAFDLRAVGLDGRTIDRIRVT